jgi:hypothetical protein
MRIVQDAVLQLPERGFSLIAVEAWNTRRAASGAVPVVAEECSHHQSRDDGEITVPAPHQRPHPKPIV